MDSVASIPSIVRKKASQYADNEIWSEYGDILPWAIRGSVQNTEMLTRIELNPLIVNEQRGWNKVNALMLAAEAGNTEVVEYLIRIGASLDLQNSIGNTALILAAAEGNIDIVKCLVENRADINVKNLWGHTAAILATEKGHLSVVKWLISRDPDQILVQNSYGKNIVLVAAEFERYEIISWLMNNFTDKTKLGRAVAMRTKRFITTIMYASKCRDKRILECLLACGADATATAKNQDTCLMWAALAGNTDTVQILLDLPPAQRPNVSAENDNGDTALTRAAENGHMPVIECLIEKYGHEMSSEEFSAAMKVAWLQGFVGVATYFMRLLDILYLPVVEVFEDHELLEIERRYTSDAYRDQLSELSDLAGKEDFHFELFLRLIPLFSSPASVLNKQLPIFYNSLETKARTRDVNVVHKLVQLMAIIRKAAVIHQMQKIDLQLRIDDIVNMLNECIGSDCMDDASTVQKMLCCSVEWHREHKCVVETVDKAQAFAAGPLVTSLDYKVSALFCTGHVSTYVDSIFWGFLMKPRRLNSNRSFLVSALSKYCISSVGRLLADKDMRHLRTLQSRFLYFRYCPAAMFFGEAISRVALFGLVALVTLNKRRDYQGFSFIQTAESERLVHSILVVFLVSNIMYEYGQICNNTLTVIPSYKRLQTYFDDGWNYSVLCGLGLIVIWAILTFNPHLLDDAKEIALGASSAACIFFSVGILRYLSLFEAVGKLIIMLQAMVVELAAFAVVFIIFSVGFCLALYCIMDQADGFSTFGTTLLTLFAASLQNFDSTYEYIAMGRAYVAIALFIEIVFVVLTSVVLLNLVIARMSAVHEKIDENSFQHWQFTRAVRTKKFLLLEEKHPFCMLPAPLNLVPSSVFLFHSFWLWRWQNHLAAQLESTNMTFRQVSRSKAGPERRYLHSMKPFHRQKSSTRALWDYICCFCKAWWWPKVTISPLADLAGITGSVQTDGHIRRPSLLGLHSDDHVIMEINKKFLEQKNVSLSLAGTATDKFMGIIMSFLAPLFEFIVVINSTIKRSYSFWGSLVYILASLVLYILFYIPFAMSLLFEALATRTKVKLVLDKDLNCTSIAVQYPVEKRYIKIKPGVHTLDRHQDYVRINVLRAVNLSRAGVAVNPIVKFRLGNFEAQTGECIRSANEKVVNEYVWSKQSLYFPIKMDALNTYKLTMEIVDVDSNTGIETRLGEFRNENYLSPFEHNLAKPEDKPHSHFNLKECLANKKFEGRLLLDGSVDTTLQVVIDSLVRDFLHSHSTLSSTTKSPKATPKSSYATSVALGQSMSWIESYCEEDNAFDEDIFTEEDRRRIFSFANRKLLSSTTAILQQGSTTSTVNYSQGSSAVLKSSSSGLLKSTPTSRMRSETLPQRINNTQSSLLSRRATSMATIAEDQISIEEKVGDGNLPGDDVQQSIGNSTVRTASNSGRSDMPLGRMPAKLHTNLSIQTNISDSIRSIITLLDDEKDFRLVPNSASPEIDSNSKLMREFSTLDSARLPVANEPAAVEMPLPNMSQKIDDSTASLSGSGTSQKLRFHLPSDPQPQPSAMKFVEHQQKEQERPLPVISPADQTQLASASSSTINLSTPTVNERTVRNLMEQLKKISSANSTLFYAKDVRIRQLELQVKELQTRLLQYEQQLD